jgi:hypothetical protein
VRLVLDHSEHADTLRPIERKPNAALTANTVSRVLGRPAPCNGIEHKLFALSMNWRAKPLVSYYLAIIQLIASTTTNSGLAVTCQLDANAYEGIKVTRRREDVSEGHTCFLPR